MSTWGGVTLDHKDGGFIFSDPKLIKRIGDAVKFKWPAREVKFYAWFVFNFEGGNYPAFGLAWESALDEMVELSYVFDGKGTWVRHEEE